MPVIAPSDVKCPPPLVRGDRIAVVAPAGPFDKEKFAAGLAVIRSWGLVPEVGAHAQERKGYLAGGDEARADDLKRCLTDPDLSAIICARGGYGTLRLLPLMGGLDLAGPAKWLIGFSDISALHHYLYRRAGWATLHGPMVTTLATADSASREWLSSILLGAADAPIHHALDEVLVPGTATGPVVGGNLATLCHLLGTAYAPQWRGGLLFLEEVGEAPYRIDRMLTQLALAGCFEGLAGVVLGQFTDCGAWEEIRSIIAERFLPIGIPVAAGLAAGHGRANLALPLGLTATLDADGGTLTYAHPLGAVP